MQNSNNVFIQPKEQSQKEKPLLIYIVDVHKYTVKPKRQSDAMTATLFHFSQLSTELSVCFPSCGYSECGEFFNSPLTQCGLFESVF